MPHLLPDAALKRFFQVIQECGDVQHEILLKLLFYTAVRVRELVRIQIDDVDLEHCRIFIQQGKGPKDRYILFPASFRLVLRSHMKAHPENQYLFESTRRALFTTRRIQQIVQSYRVRAGLTQPVHPHLFRHQMLTYPDGPGPLRRPAAADFRPREQEEPRSLSAPVAGGGGGRLSGCGQSLGDLRGIEYGSFPDLSTQNRAEGN